MLVLHERGVKVTRCPIVHPTGGSTNVSIASNWLSRSDQAEEVTTIAAAGDMCDHCLVVGTTTGGLVRLRPGTYKDAMVPRSRVEGLHKADSLHVTPSGTLVSLHTQPAASGQLVHTVKATSPLGEQLGQWSVPDYDWTGLCASHKSIFLLGRQQFHAGTELWEFRAPNRLQALDAS